MRVSSKTPPDIRLSFAREAMCASCQNTISKVLKVQFHPTAQTRHRERAATTWSGWETLSPIYIIFLLIAPKPKRVDYSKVNVNLPRLCSRVCFAFGPTLFALFRVSLSSVGRGRLRSILVPLIFLLLPLGCPFHLSRDVRRGFVYPLLA